MEALWWSLEEEAVVCIFKDVDRGGHESYVIKTSKQDLI